MTPDPGHSLRASAYLLAALQRAADGRRWAGNDGELAYAQVLATAAQAEAILAVVHELRSGVTVYPT